MSFTLDSIPTLTGKTAVVTGANGGLGLATADALAGAGAHVVMAARNQAKAADAFDRIIHAHSFASLEIVELDLGSLDSIADAADRIRATHESIDILVNNAGLMALPERQTADGFEMQFGVNVLGHWALTAHLMPLILHAERARVVSVSSVARLMGGLHADNPHLSGEYEAWKSYGQSKYGNFLFGLGLQDEFDRVGVSAQSLVAHPGLTNSDLQTHTQEQGGGGMLGTISVRGAQLIGMSTAQGALSQIRAATDPKAKGGELYGPAFGTFGPAVKRPIFRPGRAKAIEQLWEICERETRIAMEVARPS